MKLKQSPEKQNNTAKSENTAQTAKSDDLMKADKRLTSLKAYRAASKSTTQVFHIKPLKP